VRTFTSVDDFPAAVGQPLGVSEWRTITQEQVNLFADATDDHQWIHLDAERAANGPFGGTIAHGFLSLSLLPAFGAEVIKVEGARMAVNAGLDRVRFVTPVRVGVRVRDTAELLDAQVGEGRVKLSIRHTVEIENEPKPALVADSLSLIYF
jgi:acyl dehydratase